MITEALQNRMLWEEFLENRKAGGHLGRRELAAFRNFIDREGYAEIAERLSSGGTFSLPAVRRINKGFSDKKRTVFQFPEDENTVQKLMAYVLLRYDGVFADNLYSFRQNMGVKKAILKLRKNGNAADKFSFKLDIRDYFNSVNAEKLLPMLSEVLSDDQEFFRILKSLLTEPGALMPSASGEPERIELKKGIMAGAPVSGFLANLYLSALDWSFARRNVLYFRYSDDIIVFADTAEEIAAYEQEILAALSRLDLTVNEKKVFRTAPHEPWTFLGFSFRDGSIDISETAVRKIKAKMRRKARALVRWKHRKGAGGTRTAKAFIRYFNRKFFNNPVHTEMTWCRWFFPMIDTADSLKEIDGYMQECIRYICTETRTKARFNLRYETMKEMGYVSLVNCFYRFKETGFFTGHEDAEKTNHS